MKANVETRRDEYTFLGSGCNIRTHLLRAAARPRVYFIEIWARGGSREERTVRMRPGGKSNGESPFFETPNLSFEGRVGILARGPRSRHAQARATANLPPRVGAARTYAAYRPIRRSGTEDRAWARLRFRAPRPSALRTRATDAPGTCRGPALALVVGSHR